MGKKTISVVLPLYNHEQYICDAVESVLKQSLKPDEIIIVDDGSTDNSFELVKQNYGDNSKVIFWSKKNSGAHSGINSGIYRSTSDYVAILNTDDIYEPERLEYCIRLLEKNNSTQMVCTAISFIDKHGNMIENNWYNEAVRFYNNCSDLAVSLINGNFIMSTSNFVVRKSVFEKHGYFQGYRYAHDLSMILNLLVNGCEVLIDNKPLLKYRIHQNNTIAEGVLKVKTELALIISEYIYNMNQKYGSKYLCSEQFQLLYDVLDKHNLSRMIFPGLLHFNSKNLGNDTASILGNDFFKVMHNISK